jgi:hypothetical protein
MSEPSIDLPWIDETALAEKHPRIYHYTNKAKLSLILETGGLVATRYSDTNDTQECRALRKIMSDTMFDAGHVKIRELIARLGGDFSGSDDDFIKVFQDDARRCHDALLNSMPSTPFLTCFSAHEEAHHRDHGLLTMWRLYGGKGDGVALGFNTEKLRQLTIDIQKKNAVDTIFLDRVAYGSQDAQVVERLESFNGLADLFVASVLAVLSEQENCLRGRGADMMKFLMLCVTTKHQDFEDEREIRLTVFEAIPETIGDRQPLRRIGSRLLIHCVDALEEVIIGPSDDQDRVMRDVAEWLRIRELGDVEVRMSGTPFRNR